jgi:dTDP-4-amino-4,6-dideoxygalactose transaminase
VERQQEALWSGRLKNGNHWSRVLEERLRSRLGLHADDIVHLTTSGTEALRIALAYTVGQAHPGDLAVLPAFTFQATADVLEQFGYGLRFIDVDPCSWTAHPASVERALEDPAVRVVVCVDTFGAPCDYEALREVCARARVPLIADSAGAIGSEYQGTPVGTQADAHAFSMSFSKVVSAAGAGGAVVVRAAARWHDPSLWLHSALMDELHAVAALDQLDILDELLERRRTVASRYLRLASEIGDIHPQGVRPGDKHCYSNWVARVPMRAHMMRELARMGVETRDYFRALHLVRTSQHPRPSLQCTEQLDESTLALPMSSEMTEDQAETVAFAVRSVLRTCTGARAGSRREYRYA